MANHPSYTDGGIKADWTLIPDHMIGGLRRYFENGIRPGEFLTAVLSNDLRGAFERADHINERRVRDYMVFLYNYAPYGSWGSPEQFKAWIDHKGLGWPDVYEA